MQIKSRTIFNRDNLDILKGLNTNSIDLIYLDPPFNKKKVFIAPIGSSAEGASFSDIFRQEDIKEEWMIDIKEDHVKLYDFLIGVQQLCGKDSYNFCYLAYMAIRLIEMHRILKDTGSIYLHCDSTMSHYIKILMDTIFGEKNFRNEIVWCYYSGGGSKRFFAKKHDVILFYSKKNNYTFNDIKEKKYVSSKKQGKEILKNAVREWMEDVKGSFTYINMRDVWNIPIINPMAKERTGYPTQKPLKLLERIIKTSSNEGDVVLDPFCGCATTCVAAEILNRQWIGIDVSHKAYDLVKIRIIEETNLFAFYENEKDYIKNKKLEKYIDYKTNPPIRTDTPNDFMEKKYVYIISHKNYKMLKVGIAKDWKMRLNSYQTSDPMRAYKMEYKILTPQYRALEKHIHRHFNALHEWVDASIEEIINEINRFINNKKNIL